MPVSEMANATPPSTGVTATRTSPASVNFMALEMRLFRT